MTNTEVMRTIDFIKILDFSWRVKTEDQSRIHDEICNIKHGEDLISLPPSKWLKVFDKLVPNRYHHKVYQKPQLHITSEAVAFSKKAKKELGIELFPAVYRTYSGKHQLSGGAFRWFMIDIEGYVWGSSDNLKTLLRKEVYLHKSSGHNADLRRIWGDVVYIREFHIKNS